MRTKPLFMKALVVILATGIYLPSAAQRIETIAPQHQTADALAETLQASFPQVGIRAFSGVLIISAPDEASYAAVLALLRQLDTPIRNLRVTVEQRSLQSQQRGDISQQGKVVVSNAGVGGRLVLQGDDRSQQSNRQSQQTLRLLDGSEGMIQIGEQRFFPTIHFSFRPGYTIAQYGGQWHSAGTGFYIAPQLIGERRVLLRLSPYSSAFSRNGQIRTQSLYSEVQGEVGEWLPVGESVQHGASTGLSGGGHGQARYSVWVKVDLD